MTSNQVVVRERSALAYDVRRRVAVDVNEETIDATLDANGQLQLSQRPQVPAGPVRVTIRSVAPGSSRGLADVIREIAAEQRARGVRRAFGSRAASRRRGASGRGCRARPGVGCGQPTGRLSVAA
jgi:hypothetical protein